MKTDQIPTGRFMETCGKFNRSWEAGFTPGSLSSHGYELDIRMSDDKQNTEDFTLHVRTVVREY